MSSKIIAVVVVSATSTVIFIRLRKSGAGNTMAQLFFMSTAVFFFYYDEDRTETQQRADSRLTVYLVVFLRMYFYLYSRVSAVYVTCFVQILFQELHGAL